MEQLELTDPKVIPEQVTSHYKVRRLTLDWDAPNPGTSAGMVAVLLKDNLEGQLSHTYIGQEAIDLMKWLNTANFTTTSLHKKILQKLSNEGVIPGTVTGAPDPV